MDHTYGIDAIVWDESVLNPAFDVFMDHTYLWECMDGPYLLMGMYDITHTQWYTIVYYTNYYAILY